MRIVAADCSPHVLPLRRPWASAAAVLRKRAIWLLTLRTSDGASGHGECAPLPSHGSETPAQAESALRAWIGDAVGRTPAEALAALPDADTCPTPAARAAIECALLDLAAQAAGAPLARLLAPHASASVAVNAMAGTPGDTSPGELRALVARGFRVIKLKLGTADPQAEIAALRALCRELPKGVGLRLDANAAWDVPTAERFCAAAAELPIESLEEPLATPDPAAWRALQRTLPFPLAIDESWARIDREAFLAAPPVGRLILKLAVLGGPGAALATARRALHAGIECAVTTGIDGACGTWAATHLAAALAGEQAEALAHGLATSDWLAADIGHTPPLEAGCAYLAPAPGLGFVPEAAAIRRA